jgi:hypothetical protein
MFVNGLSTSADIRLVNELGEGVVALVASAAENGLNLTRLASKTARQRGSAEKGQQRWERASRGIAISSGLADHDGSQREPVHSCDDYQQSA